MSIEAMKRALDVLVALDTLFSPVARDSTQRVWINEAKESIEALRAAIQQAESEPVAWRELCRRLYVELFYCDQQMQSVTKYGKPVFTQGSTVCDVLRDAKSALESATHHAPGVPDDVVRDAERYRWLRSLEHCNEAWCFIGSGNANSNLDAAIDAAIDATQAQKGQP